MKLKKFIVYSMCSFFCILSLYILSVNLPEAFGKKQFIIGVDPQEVIKQVGQTKKASTKPTAKSGVKQVLFAPSEKIFKRLIELIKKEKKGIKLAAYLLTDYQISKALIRAEKRGVNVEIILDPKSINRRNSAVIKPLVKSGVMIYVYRPPVKKKMPAKGPLTMSQIMHHKFIVFTDNEGGKPLVWTGSLNFTYSAHKSNKENVVVLDDPYVVRMFTKEFNDLKKKRCYRYK